MHHLQSELHYSAQEISSSISNNMKWENKLKTSISNNACCFKYSVYGNTSLQQEASTFLLAKQKSITKLV